MYLIEAKNLCQERFQLHSSKLEYTVSQFKNHNTGFSLIILHLEKWTRFTNPEIQQEMDATCPYLQQEP